MEEAGQGEEAEQTENAERSDPNEPTPLDMEDSLRHSLADVRFMGIRDHHVMRGPDEIISFAKLLMRWSHNSFYIVSYCAGLLEPKERSSDKSKYAMRLRIAKKIAARTTPREPLEGEGADAIKNNREIVVTLADCKQDRSLRNSAIFRPQSGQLSNRVN